MNIRRELFCGEPAERYFIKVRKHVVMKIHEFNMDELAPQKIGSVTQRFLENYSYEPLRIPAGDPVLDIPVEVTRQVPSDFGGMRTYKSRMHILRVPFVGSPKLFDLEPQTWYSSPGLTEKIVENECVAIRLYEDGKTAQEIKSRLDKEIQILKNNACELTNEVLRHNEQLQKEVPQAIEGRIRQLEDADKLLHGIGFAVRKRGDPIQNRILPVERKPLPITSAVPAPDQLIQPPQRTLLEARIFEDILSTLSGMGVAIERSPTAFIGMEEETLRTWFLVALNGVYQGTATAETFNMLGKVDITIRHLGEILFIAECKFWSGSKGLSEAIDQLLGYLTWREQRAALLLFNRNKDFSGVLAQIPAVVKGHPNFVRLDGQPSLPSAFRFTLRSKTDGNKEVQITLLAFDVPQNPKG